MKKSELRHIIKEELDKILVPRRSPEERAKKDKRADFEKYEIEEYFEEHTPDLVSYKKILNEIYKYDDDELLKIFNRRISEHSNVTKKQYIDVWEEYMTHKKSTHYWSEYEYWQWVHVSWISAHNSKIGHDYAETLA